jgi:apolipoprotein N-acyltransferase
MLAMNIFRAIENHVSVIRVSTSGVSGVIDPSGRILATVHDENSKEVDIIGQVTGQVPLSSKRTFYTHYGDWFIIGLAASLLFFLLLSFRNMGTRSTD